MLVHVDITLALFYFMV